MAACLSASIESANVHSFAARLAYVTPSHQFPTGAVLPLLDWAERTGAWVTVCGTNAGIHVLLLLRDVSTAKLPSLVERAAAAGVGVYPSTAL
jgi:DNA-binding transcriptional MocR family regulator